MAKDHLTITIKADAHVLFHEAGCNRLRIGGIEEVRVVETDTNEVQHILRPTDETRLILEVDQDLHGGD